METEMYAGIARMKDGTEQTKTGDLIAVANWADKLLRDSLCTAEININRIEKTARTE